MFRVERDPSCGGSRSRRQAATKEAASFEGFLFFLRIENGSEELRDLIGLDARHSFLRRNQFLIDHVAGDLHRGESGALCGTRLQQIELARLDGELNVLHVAKVAFEFLVDVLELLVDVRHRLLERFLVADRLRFGNWQRRANSGDNVLALRVRKVFAEKFALAGRRIACECDPGGAVFAHVAEHHRLHRDGGAPVVRDSVQLAIGDRALIVPGKKNGTDRAPELLVWVLWEFIMIISYDIIIRSKKLL